MLPPDHPRGGDGGLPFRYRHRGAIWLQQTQFTSFELMGMDKTQLQWLLAGIGAVVVALMYLWGIRARLKEEIRKRRRRSSLIKEPKLEDSVQIPDGLVEAHDFGELGRITPDHHLADKVLVDVEIRPLYREADREPAPSADKSVPETKAWPFDREPVSSRQMEPEPEAAAASREPLDESGQQSVASPPSRMTIALTVMAPHHRPFKGADIRVAAEEAGFQLGAAGLFERFPDGESVADTPVFSLAHLRKPGSFDLRALKELTTPGLLLFMNLPGPLDGMNALDLLVLAADRLARKLEGVICDEHRVRMTNRGLANLRHKVAELQGRLQ